MLARILTFGRNTFASLGERNYRLYFIGQAISLSGTWMQTVALGWLALTLTGSGTQLGFIVAGQFLPLLIFGPWGGLVVDRLDKRRMLIATQVAFGLLAGLLSLVVFAHAEQLWMLYAFAISLGIVRVFDNPLRQSFVLEMVEHHHLKNAVSLNSTANNLARAVGPLIGGVIIAAAGIALCFLLNALSYLAVIGTIFWMREEELRKTPPVAKKSGQIIEGLRYAQSTPLIRDILVMAALIGTFAYEFQVSLPLLAEQTFHAGAPGYALLMAAFGAGAAVGGLFAAGSHTIARRHLVISAFFFGISILGTALAPSFQGAVFGLFVVGIFSINFTSLANTMIQLESAPAMRGRVMSLWSIAMIGSTPIGGPMIGWIGEHLGARAGVGIGGIVTLLVLAIFMAMKDRAAEKDEPIAASPILQTKD